MNIIGIAGRRSDGSSAGSGKDEVAKILAAKHGFVIVSFADEIKRTAMRWYDFTPEQLWGSKKEEPDLRYPRDHGPWLRAYDHDVCMCCGQKWHSAMTQCYLNPRFVCRFLGTEAGRMFWFDTWVNFTIKIAKELLEGTAKLGYSPEHGLNRYDWAPLNPPEGVCIPDVRWPAENEGKVIKESGGQLWLVERPGTAQTGTATAKHASETQPIPTEVFDHIIHNDGTLADLETFVGCAFEDAQDAATAAALAPQALADLEAGNVVPHAELRAQLGLDKESK